MPGAGRGGGGGGLPPLPPPYPGSSSQQSHHTQPSQGGGGGGGGRGPPPQPPPAPVLPSYPHVPLTRREFNVLAGLWPHYFEGQILSEYDARLPGITIFRSFLASPLGDPLLRAGARALLTDPGAPLVVTYEYAPFVERCQVRDFALTLHKCPVDTLACVGLATTLCLLALLPPDSHHFLLETLLPPPQQGDAQSGIILGAPSPCLRIRFANLEPLTPMSGLKSGVVGRFVSVKGTVARCSAVRPLVLAAAFQCPKCTAEIPQRFPDGVFTYPEACPTPRCKNRLFELLRETAATVDFQKIKIQEVDDGASAAEAGRIPRTVEVELREDLVDSCVPGDVVTVTGVVKTISAEALSGRRAARDGRHQSLYLLYLQANGVQNRRQEERKADELLEDDDSKVEAAGHFSVKQLQGIRAIATQRFCFDLLVASLCPAIFGHELVKAGLLLTLFGGTKRQQDGRNRTRVRVRSDPHILLVGDPGLGKSQMLRAAAAAAPRSVYVCGNVVTSTGLTVTLASDGRGDVALEAGALVLSDQGVCCIDELDKLSCSYHALLEAMEQQQISIAKSGVVTSLSARCSILAAANPVGGQYHRGKTVSENLKMSGALFSRFDLVFIMLDRPDDDHDSRLSRHIVSRAAQHKGSGGGGGGKRGGNGGYGYNMGGGGYDDGDDGGDDGFNEDGSVDRETRTLSQRLRRGTQRFLQEPIPLQLLRKYIAYARKYVHPRLSREAAAVLQETYLRMRAEARLGRSMPITTRQLESLIRLSQARAKAELREVVTKDDALDVVEMLQESLLDAFTTEAGEVDFAHHSGSMSLAKQVKAFVSALTKESNARGTPLFQRADLQELAEKRLRLQIADFDRFLDVLRQEAYVLQKGPRLFQVMTSSVSPSGASKR